MFHQNKTLQVLVKKLLQSMGQDPNSEEKLTDAKFMSKFFAFKVHNRDEEEGFMEGDDVDPLGGGGEVFDEDDDSNSTSFISSVKEDVYHLVDQGRCEHITPNPSWCQICGLSLARDWGRAFIWMDPK